MTYEKNKFLLRIISLIDNNNNIKPTTLDFLRPFVNLKNLSLNSYVNLKQLEGSYNQFYGSLKPLENLSKLKELNISNTDIDSGLEFLSESIEIFRCSTDYYKAKCKVIANIFANEQGILETDMNGIKDFSKKLKAYKQKLQDESQELKTQLMELKQKKEDSDRNLLNLEMIAEIYYQCSQMEIKTNQKKYQKIQMELINLQQQIFQLEQDNQELKLLSNRQIMEFTENENAFKTQINCLQNENQILAGNYAEQLNLNKLMNEQIVKDKLNLQEQLDQSEARNQELKLLSAKQIREFAEKETIQLKQNKLTNKQVQSQIGKLKKDKLDLQEKLIKSAACIQKLKSQKANLIKQKDSLEDKLNQSQTTYQQIENEIIDNSNMLKALLQSQDLNGKENELKAELEKEILQLEGKLNNEKQIKAQLNQALQFKENKINELERKLIYLDQELCRNL
ncbi:unnamed protein product [Rhizophagus irregularis]|nr:unnamed protein product [Rhizophagus irregularis]CAB5359714.1 unnamed protein product [Rhizophagus irregularis]